MATVLLKFLGPSLFIGLPSSYAAPLYSPQPFINWYHYVFSLGLQLSTLNTARTIFKLRSAGDLSPVPFIALISNCVVWSLYGFLLKDYSIFVPNFCGIFTGAICTAVHQCYSTRIPYTEYCVCAALCSFAVLLSFTDKSVLNTGLLGCALSVAMTGSPLAVLSTVLREKSTASLPFSTCFIMWLSSASWLLYGLFITEDPIIYVPNFLGFSLASAQISLFAVFGFDSPRQTKAHKDSSV